MAYFDYSSPDLPDVSAGISSLGDALTNVMKRRQQQAQFDEEMRFKREDEARKFKQAQMNIDYQNRIIDERNRRDRLEFNAKQQERAAAAAEKARHAASPQEAQAILHGTVLYDPETGKETGRGELVPGQTRNVGPEPLMPAEPDFPREAAGAVIPDIVQATPGMPPELAAMLRGKGRTQPTAPAPQQSPELEALMQRALPESSLDEAHRAELESLRAGHADRAGKVFVDRIDDEGNAFLFDEQGNKQVVPATKDMQEGQWIAPPGSESVQRFDPSVQAARFESPTRGEDAAAAYSKYQQDRGTYEADMTALPGRQAAYAAEQRNAEAERPYTIKFGPNDPGTTFDFRTQRTAGRAQAAQDFLASLPDSMSDRDRAAALQIHAGIQSGTIDPAKAGAMFQKERLTASGEAFKDIQGEKRDAAALERAKLRGESPMVAIARQGLGLRVEDAGNKQFQDFLRNQGYKADVATMKDLVDTNQSLKVGNSALDVTAGAQFAKKAQGAGVLTDKDYDRFWSAIGGIGERPENWFDNVIEGKMGEGKRRIVVDAIRHKVDYEANRLKNVAIQADKKFAGEAWYPGTRAAYFDFLPNLPAMGQAQGPRIGSGGRKGLPEVNARIKAKGKGVTPESVADVLKRVLAQ